MDKKVTVKIGRDRYKTEVLMQEHSLIADEPQDVGGTDLGPNPKELLLASLGTCKSITIRMYADRKEWPLEAVEIDLSMGTQQAELQDTTFINCHIKLIGDLDDAQRKRLLLIGDKCPVHKLLSNPIVIDSNLI